MTDPLSASAALLSLPGIFMSCVQCFELIQSGRNSERDLLILTTKFSNQQLRFTKWGEACGFGSTREYDVRLNEPSLRPNIQQTLQCIETLLESGVTLIKGYGRESGEYEAVTQRPHSRTRLSWTAFKGRLSRGKKPSNFKNAARWAISDKKSLDELVKHLSDLVGDLERLTRDLGVNRRQQILVEYEIESISDIQALERMEASRVGSSDRISDAASIRLKSLKESIGSRRFNFELVSTVGSGGSSHTYATAPEEALRSCHEPISVLQEPQSLREEIVSANHTQDPLALDIYSSFNPGISQNRRLMDSLLARAESSTELQEVSPIDTTRLGNLVQRLRLEKLDQESKQDPVVASFIHQKCSAEARANKRIMKELKWFKTQPKSYYDIHPVADSVHTLLGSIEGPPGSPYDGGIFHVLFLFPKGYPIRSPLCRFVTKVYHPNIAPNGEICIDSLSGNWGPHLSIELLLIGIASILDDPCLTDPLVPEIAEMYVRNRGLYEENARTYTKKYGSVFEPDMDTIGPTLRDMIKEIAEVEQLY